MYYLQDLEDFEMLKDYQIEHINKILKDNRSSREYDLIDIDIYDSKYVFMMKNVNKAEKLKLLACISYVYPENDMEFYDINGDYVSIDDDFEKFAKDYSSLDGVGDCGLHEEYMYYYLKNIGFSPNRICKVDMNNI